jgi:Mg-chelatase subunit ChlD
MPTPEAMLKESGFEKLNYGGGTPMIAPLMWAEQQLRSRKASRRVCIWLCDGQPNGNEEQAVRALMARRSGIEHVGIGLQCGLGSILAPGKFVVVQDMTTLASAFEKLLVPK